MPLAYVLVHVARLVSTVTATFGLTKPVETEIAGSPFLARVYRVPQTTVQRDEDQPGTATLDQMQRMSVLDPLCGVQINDIAFLPRPDGSYIRAKVIRIRFYSDRIQYDLETGAEGNGPPPTLDVADDASADAVDAAPPAPGLAPSVDIADSASADAVDTASAPAAPAPPLDIADNSSADASDAVLSGQDIADSSSADVTG